MVCDALPMRVTAYIDGFNLYYRRLKRGPGRAYKWLDLSALADALAGPGHDVVAVRYFTARITERPDDPHAPVRQDFYLKALGEDPRITTHLGEFKDRRKWRPPVEETMREIARERNPQGHPTLEVYDTEEKGSDVNLASYLLLDAFQDRMEAALVVSNDADLCTPVSIVQRELGCDVWVANPEPRHRTRRKGLTRGSVIPEASLHFAITTTVLGECQLPDSVQVGPWRISRPTEWA